MNIDLNPLVLLMVPAFFVGWTLRAIKAHDPSTFEVVFMFIAGFASLVAVVATIVFMKASM